MHVVSIKNNANANMRSQAAIYASEAIDRMRANLPNAMNGSYNIALNDPAPTPAGTPTVAEDDLIRWLGALAVNLPQGDGAIAVNNATRVATVTIS
jgi:Tfp pilus assembly protein PilV